jgi:response regulator RpfG family c-di-GMP phosphodiesterase
LSDELDDCSDALVYLNDNIMERDLGLIVIGDKLQYERVTDIIHEQGITEFVERPLDIEKLIKSVAQYMEENTGEKRKKTVLIVDDDITYMRTIYEWLKGSYHVGMASSGLQAISYLTKNKADLVLLDYEMPIADGPQVLSMLKSDSETDQIPVMFLTGKSDAQSVLAVVNLKPVDYLLKTIDKPGLLGKLDAFFKSRALNM